LPDTALGSLAGVTILRTILTAAYTGTIHLPATAPARAAGSIDQKQFKAPKQTDPDSVSPGQRYTLGFAAATAATPNSPEFAGRGAPGTETTPRTMPSLSRAMPGLLSASSSLDGAGEQNPLLRGEGQLRAVRVLGVAHRDHYQGMRLLPTPSATELHEPFSVSRNSAARALRLLCREDWIVTAQGWGSFVADELPRSAG